ncbi:uncharacterized protein LOC109728973 [Ananas comosus]|uniref:Uncharacterized protein LOC109728973 n=1 Tax=Ananas comosus TaxID=4615 RepID=A0A6P5H6R4_ANACO|nr:uncharacterized protein LOC109728973 [Ananas comosus]
MHLLFLVTNIIRVYEEANAIKRRKRYARSLVDLHMKIYRYGGMEPWSPKKRTISDVPEGAVLKREHTAMANLFSCLWFHEALDSYHYLSCQFYAIEKTYLASSDLMDGLEGKKQCCVPSNTDQC